MFYNFLSVAPSDVVVISLRPLPPARRPGMTAVFVEPTDAGGPTEGDGGLGTMLLRQGTASGACAVVQCGGANALSPATMRCCWRMSWLKEEDGEWWWQRALSVLLQTSAREFF